MSLSSAAQALSIAGVAAPRTSASNNTYSVSILTNAAGVGECRYVERIADHRHLARVASARQSGFGDALVQQLLNLGTSPDRLGTKRGSDFLPQKFCEFVHLVTSPKETSETLFAKFATISGPTLIQTLLELEH
jgi:hypothetical protein